MKRAHGRGPELTVSRQEGKLFPADVLRYFLPKTKKNGLGLLEDGLDMPRDGVDTLLGVRSSYRMPVMGPHRAPVHWSVGRRREAARASSHLFRGLLERPGQVSPIFCMCAVLIQGSWSCHM